MSADISAESLAFQLPNGGPGPGPDPLSLTDLDADFAVLLFQRDHFCGNCRKQVQAIVVDLRTAPRVIYTYVGTAPADRPSIDALLAEIDTARGDQ